MKNKFSFTSSKHDSRAKTHIHSGSKRKSYEICGFVDDDVKDERFVVYLKLLQAVCIASAKV